MGNDYRNTDLIGRVKKEIAGLNNFRIIADIDELYEKVTADKFYLVMLGLFKRGKSSLINALLKEEIVPAGVIPLTAIITLVEFGRKKYAEIFFMNDKAKKIKTEEIGRYVSEKENPHNIKQVSFIKIYHDSEMLRSVTIIDTPGVGSSLEHNTETTNQIIDKIDAALFILSVEVPITKTEVDFLLNIKMRIPKIIFVLNKIDLFTDNELLEAENYNKTVLNEICDENLIEIIKVSSKNALLGYQKENSEMVNESRIELLRHRINLLAETEKELIMNISVANRLKFLISEATSLIKFRIESLKMPENALEEKTKHFSSLLSIMKNEKGDFDILMEGRTKQLNDYVFEKMNEIGAKLINEIRDDFSKNQKVMINRMKRENLFSIQDEYIEKLRKRFDEVKIGLESKLVEDFKNILNNYSKGSNEFISKLLNSLGSIFNFDITFLSEKFDLDVFTSFYYNFNTEQTILGLNSGLIRSKMPKIIIEKLVFNKMLDMLIEKINSNCGRVIYDITYRVQESFLKFKYDINEKHEKILADLEKILNETLRKKLLKEQNIEDELYSLEAKIMKLEQIKGQIEKAN